MPTTLTAQSRTMVNNHVEVGASILSGSDSALIQAAEKVARHHHERFDGSGHPSGLVGEAIPALARVIAVADAFAAATSPRPHRNRLSANEAFEEVQRGAGTQFDPALVAAFEQLRERLGVA
jgi:putative two-component system response regulator